jgi:hypothetical protein
MTSIIGVDLASLSRGEGEWRNLQEIIRKSFFASFQQIERQQEQINQVHIIDDYQVKSSRR